MRRLYPLLWMVPLTGGLFIAFFFLPLKGCAKKEAFTAMEPCAVDECVRYDPSHPEKGLYCRPCPDFTADVRRCQIESMNGINELAVDENKALLDLHNERVNRVVEKYLDKFQEQAQKGQQCTK